MNVGNYCLEFFFYKKEAAVIDDAKIILLYCIKRKFCDLGLETAKLNSSSTFWCIKYYIFFNFS